MSEAAFRDAFEQIGLAAGQAAALPDHRERPRESPDVTVQSARGEVSVTVQEGKIHGLVLDEFWLATAAAGDAALLIQETINTCYQQWAEQELADLATHTPDLKELYGALGAARARLDEAWVRALTEYHS